MNALATLNQTQRTQIAQAIAEVETHTSAEIVCAVSTESGRYDRAEGIIGIFFALVGLGAAHILHQQISASPGDWSVSSLHLAWQAAAVVVGFVIGSLLASYVHAVRRLVVRRQEMRNEVRSAAIQTFALSAINTTEQRTGVLIYVSLFEKRLVILPDVKTEDALGQAVVHELCDQGIAGLKQGRTFETLLELVQRLGEILPAKMPADRTTHANELADHVLTIHPRPSALIGQSPATEADRSPA